MAAIRSWRAFSSGVNSVLRAGRGLVAYSTLGPGATVGFAFFLRLAAIARAFSSCSRVRGCWALPDWADSLRQYSWA